MSDFQAELAELMPEQTTMPRQGVGINVKRLLKLRGRIMALSFVLSVVPLLTAIGLLIPKEYVAMVDFEFKATIPSIINEQGRPMTGTTYDNYVNTQIKLIRGYTILSLVKEDPAVAALPCMQANRGAELFYLRNNLEIEPQRRTELVSVYYRDEDYESAQLILQTIVDIYMNYVEEEERRLVETRQAALREKEKEFKNQLALYRESITELRKEYELPVGNTPGLEATETESYRINLAQAEADITTARTQQRQSEKLVERVAGFIERNRRYPEEPVFALGVEDKVTLDPNIGFLSEQLAAAQQELSVIEERYIEGAPQLNVKQYELEALNEKLERVKSEVRAKTLNSLLAQYQYDVTVHAADLEDAQERQKRFSTLLEETRMENIGLSDGLSQIEDTEKRYNDLRERLRSLNNTLMTIELERSAPARINVIGEVEAPSDPDMTRRIKFMLVALFACFSLAIGLGVALEFFDQNIRSAEDVAYVTQAPVLASVPHSSEDRLPSDLHMETLSDQCAASLSADEYRRAVARLLTASNGRGRIKTCMITSPTREEGKTTFACNAAIILAQANRKVLLVDLDSRAPGVERAFGLAQHAGIAEMLSGEAPAYNPDSKTKFENLFILGPGLRTEVLNERLVSPAMVDFLEGARDLFDYVLIDCPAALLMAEARLLAPLVESVVVVSAAGVSTFGMLRRCVNMMKASGGNLLGIVLNGVRHSPGGYLRRNIDLYYASGIARQRPLEAGVKAKKG